jgi:hypothetical protein
MTVIIVTASTDPGWVRPLAGLRMRGVGCVVVSLDAQAYRRYAAIRRGEASPDPEVEEAAQRRQRALRHALAEYELRVYTVQPARALGELLAG